MRSELTVVLHLQIHSVHEAHQAAEHHIKVHVRGGPRNHFLEEDKDEEPSVKAEEGPQSVFVLAAGAPGCFHLLSHHDYLLAIEPGAPLHHSQAMHLLWVYCAPSAIACVWAGFLSETVTFHKDKGAGALVQAVGLDHTNWTFKEVSLPLDAS